MRTALAIVAGLVLGIGATALATNKTPTLSPPTDHTRVNSICMHYEPQQSKVSVSVDAFAFDPATGIKDQAVVTFLVLPSNANVQNLYNAAITQWTTARGY